MNRFLQWLNREPQTDPAAQLERIAHYLTKEYCTSSFRERGFLLPEQHEAINLVIRLEREVRQ